MYVEVSNYILINDEKIINSDVVPKMEITHNEIQEYQCLGGEDFSEYSNHSNVPGAFLFIGVELFKNICFEYFNKMEEEEQ